MVNNAGVSGLGQVEWVALEKYREVAAVNLFGVLAVTKAALPLVRRARGARGAGGLSFGFYNSVCVCV